MNLFISIFFSVNVSFSRNFYEKPQRNNGSDKIFYRMVTAIAIYLCENHDSEEKLLPKNDPKLRSQVIHG